MNLDVVVVGAGLAGAATAVGLVLAGHKVVLVDIQAPSPLESGSSSPKRVSTFNPASENILDRLGVWQAVARHQSHSFRQMRVWEGDRAEALAFGADDVEATHLGHIVENALVSEQLRLRFESLGGEVCFGHKLAGLSQTRNGVMITLSNDRELAADLLVAADGGRSRVRELLSVPVSHTDYKQLGIVCHLRCAALDEDTAWQRFLETGPLAFLPLGGDEFSIVWSMPKELAERRLDIPKPEFERELKNAFQLQEGSVKVTSDRAGFPLHRIHAQRYVDDRVVLIGDAAHVAHPLAGQGANMGLLDVAALLEVLDSGQPLDVSLRRYERWRRSDNEIMLTSLHGLKWFFGLRQTPLKALRAMGFQAINRISPLRSAFVTHASGFGGRVPEMARR